MEPSGEIIRFEGQPVGQYPTPESRLPPVTSVVGPQSENELQQKLEMLEALVGEALSKLNKQNDSTLHERKPSLSRPLPSDSDEDIMSSELKGGDSFEHEDLCRGLEIRYRRSKKTRIVSSRSEFPPPTTQQSGLQNSEFASVAMEIIMYDKSGNDQPRKIVFRIHSMELQDLIRTAVQPLLDHEHVEPWKTSPMIIESKNVYIMHSWDALQKASTDRTGHRTTQGQKELACFLGHIERYEIEAIQARRKAFNERIVDYAHIWTLFPPGAEVVGYPFQDGPQISVVHRSGPISVPSPGSRSDGISISCWFYDWDGANLIRKLSAFTIVKFKGYKSIEDLPCYPLRLYRANGEGEHHLRERLAARGRHFQDLCINCSPQRLLRCSKIVAADEEVRTYMNPRVGRRFQQSLVDEDNGVEIIVDPVLYHHYRQNPLPPSGAIMSSVPCECTLCDLEGYRGKWNARFKFLDQLTQWTEIDGESSEAVNPVLENMLYAQLPPRVLGYLIRQKRWGQMQVDATKDEAEEVESEVRHSWKQLAMDETHKANIYDLVSNHLAMGKGQNTARIRDLIRGKGEGLVILLHGISGVGKTMTAEALARAQRRRLLKIDPSDFDYTDSGQVSDVFKKYFHMAHSWGALLLLDEADVFLQLRRRAELQQNALVSVMLRELEYFQGVLIMTTNRILTLDIAMQSRVHYCAYFPPINPDGMDKIWRTFEEQLNDNNCKSSERQKLKTYYRQIRKDMVKRGFNGRDIRNIFTTAQLLSYPLLTCDNIQKVVESVADFRDRLAILSNRTQFQQAGADQEDIEF